MATSGVVMTAIRKPSIPSISALSPDVATVLRAVKENIEIMTGLRNGAPQLVQLTTSATNAQIIASINSLIVRLNSSGQ